MTKPDAAHPHNAPGRVFVDLTCVECTLCVRACPNVFSKDARAKAYVHTQPTEETDLAVVEACTRICPSNSIKLHKD